MVGFAERFAGPLQASDDFVVGLRFDLEGDVVEIGDRRRMLGDAELVNFGVGELEERQGSPVGHCKEGVAHRDRTAELRVMGHLAPGRDQGNAQRIFEEAAVGFVVLHHIGVVVQPFGQTRQRPGGGFCCSHLGTSLERQELQVHGWTGTAVPSARGQIHGHGSMESSNGVRDSTSAPVAVISTCCSSFTPSAPPVSPR